MLSPKSQILFILAALAFLAALLPSCIQVKPRPNILFAIMDDATFEHLGAYGCRWIRTPAFDRVASEGILFTRAYTPNAKCAPSRAAILTGRNSWQLEEAVNHWCYFPPKFKSLFECLEENNYHTGFTGKGWAPGVALDSAGEKRMLTGKAYQKQSLEPPTPFISKNDYTGNFKDFLKDWNRDNPFVFWYGSLEPHRRYEYGSGISKGNHRLAEVGTPYAFWPDNDTVKTDLLDYAFEIEYFDYHLGQMIHILEEMGELDNTLIIVTSDNGMPFPRIKGQEYELSNHMPLAMRWPDGIEGKGRKVDDFVSFIDLAPTLLDVQYIEADQSGMAAMSGQSLLTILNSPEHGQIESHRDHVLIGKERHDVGRPNDWGFPIRGIFQDEYLLIQNFQPDRWPAGDPVTGYLNCDGSPTKTLCLNARSNPETKDYWQWSFGLRPEFELYNIQEDPQCMNNLDGQESYYDIALSLMERMHDELKVQEDPRMLGNPEIFDSYVYADSSGVNFYERYMAGDSLNFGWVNESDFEKE